VNGFVRFPLIDIFKMILYTDLEFPNKKNIKMSTKTFSKSQMVLKPYKCNMDLSNTFTELKFIL
jgi:hypothetical protein